MSLYPSLEDLKVDKVIRAQAQFAQTTTPMPAITEGTYQAQPTMAAMPASAELALSHHGDKLWQLYWDRASWEKEKGGRVGGVHLKRRGGREEGETLGEIDGRSLFLWCGGEKQREC
ncbi:hypothetical protein E3U43_013335 [Larimichthys crocea]|uniref:Uncharacterized protein n=1 Tax=Larimichthys crocea TaxID=215358 RepID=A0ACD3R8Y1_LARCR|nr:hypothetical protein E3U43_013335 [Larimichthys crocea]